MLIEQVYPILLILCSMIILIHFKFGLEQTQDSKDEFENLLLKATEHAVILQGEKTIMNSVMSGIIESQTIQVDKYFQIFKQAVDHGEFQNLMKLRLFSQKKLDETNRKKSVKRSVSTSIQYPSKQLTSLNSLQMQA